MKHSKTFLIGFNVLDEKPHLDFCRNSQVYLSYSACVDKHEDVGMGSSESVQEWSGARRQRGIGDMTGIGQFSE